MNDFTVEPIRFQPEGKKYLIRLRGPVKGPHTRAHSYEFFQAETPEEIGLAAEHYFGDPHHGEDGCPDCPVCLKLGREPVVVLRRLSGKR